MRVGEVIVCWLERQSLPAVTSEAILRSILANDGSFLAFWRPFIALVMQKEFFLVFFF